MAGICCWVIVLVPNAAVIEHGSTRLPSETYTHNMAAATLNIDST